MEFPNWAAQSSHASILAKDRSVVLRLRGQLRIVERIRLMDIESPNPSYKPHHVVDLSLKLKETLLICSGTSRPCCERG